MPRYTREPVSQHAASHAGSIGCLSNSVDFRAAVTMTKAMPSARSAATSSMVRSETKPSPIVDDGSRRHSRVSPDGLSTTARFASRSRLTILVPCCSNHAGKWTIVPSRSEKMARNFGAGGTVVAIARAASATNTLRERIFGVVVPTARATSAT